MCWSASASAVIGTAGVATAVYAHHRGEPKYLTWPLFYFSLMEFLQFFSYMYIGQCALTQNSFLTVLSYIHIAFQPVFINMLLMSFMPKLPSARVRRNVYAICFATTALLLAKMIPFDAASLCREGQTLCGQVWCSVRGNWHLAWSMPQYNWPVPFDGMVYYSLAAFVVPFFYAVWFDVFSLIITGPVLAYYLSSGNPLEWPAVWCFYSVLMILLSMINISYQRRTGKPFYRELLKRLK